MPRVTPRFAGSPPNLRLPLIWNAGLGALTHVQLPADQAGTVAVSTKTAADAAQAGLGLTVQAAAAVAGTLTEGAAAGGAVTVQAGNAARLTSGNAAGGRASVIAGAGIGSGAAGAVTLRGVQIEVRNQADSGYTALHGNIILLRDATAAIQQPSVGQYKWNAHATDGGNGAADTGLARSAAGVARFSDGSTGMGKAMAEEFQVSSDSTSRAKLKVTKVTKAHDSDLFNAAGLTDSVAVYTQPANSILIAAYMVLDTQFAAVGMTDLDVTLGDAGNNGGILNATMNLTSDAATTRYATKGAYFEATAGLLLREAATAWTAYATAVGANLDTTSAGSVSLYFVTLEW